MPTNPLFESTSREQPQLLSISFADDPKGSLGAQLVNCDKAQPFEMMIPGYAIVGRLLEGNTVARRCGVHVGDCIVAVNGQGFRRFAPDFKEEELENLSPDVECASNDNKIIANMDQGDTYQALLAKIKAMKTAAVADTAAKKADPAEENGATENGNGHAKPAKKPQPLVINLERYTWDAKTNSWPRFLAARDGNVPAAMKMLQLHEQWKVENFPIDLTRDGLQEILRLKAVADIVIPNQTTFPPTVYINFGKLQTVDTVSNDDVVSAFLIFTELMLGRSNEEDPRAAKCSQFIDLSGVSISSGIRADMLKTIYNVFEPNYPETLGKMVMYPVSTVMGATARTLLNFVNEKTQKKFVLTNSLQKVCEELGWDQREVESCGGVTEFMHKYESAGSSMILE